MTPAPAVAKVRFYPCKLWYAFDALVTKSPKLFAIEKMKDDKNIANKLQVHLNFRNIRIHMVWAAGSQSQLETAVLTEDQGGCLETVEGTDIQVRFLLNTSNPAELAQQTCPYINKNTCTLES